jgi:hypothetical protein
MVMTWIVIGVAVLIAAYLGHGKKKSSEHARSVCHDTNRFLREQGEPEGAVNCYLNSIEFVINAKSSFGRMSVLQAAKEAVERYDAKRGCWLKIATK